MRRPRRRQRPRPQTGFGFAGLMPMAATNESSRPRPQRYAPVAWPFPPDSTTVVGVLWTAVTAGMLPSRPAW